MINQPVGRSPMELAQELGRVEGDIAKGEAALRDMERRLDSVKGNYTGAVVGFILGLVFLFLFFPIGIVLFLAAILAAVTSTGKQSQIRRDMANVENHLVNLRSYGAQVRAQLMVPAAFPAAPPAVSS